MLRLGLVLLLAGALYGCVADPPPAADLLGRIPPVHVTLWTARF